MSKNYWGLWTILAAAFAIFIVLSAFSPVKIFGHELASTGMLQSLIAVTEETEAAATVSSAEDAVEETAGEENVLTIDTTAQRLLFIGDSMLEGLSPRLAAYAKKNGHRLYSVIWYSSTSEVWGRSVKLREFIELYKPTFVFICLGSNELFVRNIEQKRDAYVKNILSHVGDLPYMWIGPPNWKEDTGINRLVRANARKGGFFLSNGMRFDRTSDGAHPTRRSAEAWMDSVVRWMPSNSFHPIRLDYPGEGTAKPDKLILLQPEELVL